MMNSQYLQKKKLPDAPGVYFFVGCHKEILYIGKATSLRSRVRSYFARDIDEVRSPLIKQMVEEAVSIDVRVTDSVLEALILEADLIKKFQPKYNTDEKDDKSFNCVVITKEDFPRVLVVRKHELGSVNLKPKSYKLKAVFGPFPNGNQLRDALKIVRRIFPYRDAKCFPPPVILPFLKGVPHSDEGRDLNPPSPCPPFGSRRGGLATRPTRKRSRCGRASFMKGGIKRFGKPCFNRQIGLCPGVCTGEISKQEYARTIRNIKLFFSGKKGRILKNLKSEMQAAAKVRAFERAGEIKKTIFALEHIQDVALVKRDAAPAAGAAPRRIEAYDIAHISGTDVVGAMVVLENGVPKKSDYRKFKIKGGFGNNDIASLTEVIERRLNHSEWPLPALFVADGAKPQKSVIEQSLKARNLSIPVAAVTKNERHRPEKILGDPTLVKRYERAILLANSEAHRFALSSHRLRRTRNFLYDNRSKGSLGAKLTLSQ